MLDHSMIIIIIIIIINLFLSSHWEKLEPEGARENLIFWVLSIASLFSQMNGEVLWERNIERQ